MIGKFGFLNNFLPYYYVDGAVLETTPRKMAELLVEGKILYAPIPSIFYIKNKKILRSYKFCISSDGEVMSVAVFSKDGKLGKKVAVTSESMTSLEMFKIILRELKIGCKIFEVKMKAEEALKEFDSVLLIGDEALEAFLKYKVAMDIGQAWKDLTGLPAVFGISASLKSVDAREIDRKILESTKKAYENFEEVVKKASNLSGFPESLLAKYFKLLNFELGVKEEKGLKVLEELCTRTV
ncbi:MAG: menaquinone biosynthesis protein [Archaeoglobaceae archaeon]|nr:menaquinone biosynthesis protein [Archaeoglobaceae archaeon]